MTRIQDKEKRKEKVLYLIVKSFIKNCIPISSEFLCENFDLKCSPATVRNDMAELEEEGFLYQPHTSAGRIPTEKAYRYFVDFFLEKKELDIKEKNKILEVLNSEYDLETLLRKTSQILADLTEELSMVSFIGERGKLFTHGMKYIIKEPEFRDLQRLGTLLELLEDEDFIFEILNRDLESQTKVFIGSDLGVEEFKEFSFVLKSFRFEDGPKGRLAVIGPLRMDYERILASLDFISSCLNKILRRLL